MTQAGLARAVERSPGTINHLLCGRMATCTPELAARIAEALGVELDELFAATVASRTGQTRSRRKPVAA